MTENDHTPVAFDKVTYRLLLHMVSKVFVKPVIWMIESLLKVFFFQKRPTYNQFFVA